jgi:hypothetical protein
MYQKMNPEFKADWLAALRSGEYPQGRGALRNKQGEFCCLGVACDIEEKKGLLVRVVLYGSELSVYRDAINPAAYLNFSFLPDETIKRTGISEEAARVLSCMNDSELKIFNEIADWIEENL